MPDPTNGSPFESRRVREQWWPGSLTCLVIGENPGTPGSAYFYDPMPEERADPVEVRHYLLGGLARAGILREPTLEAFRGAGFLFDHAIREQLPADVIRRERQAAGRFRSERAHAAEHLRSVLSAAPQVWVMGRIALDAVRHIVGLQAIFPEPGVDPEYDRSVDGIPRFFVSRYLNRYAARRVESIVDRFARFFRRSHGGGSVGP